MPAWKIYYDCDCKLCIASKGILVQWAQKANQPLEVFCLGSLESEEPNFNKVSFALVIEDKTYRAEKTWFELVKIAPWYLRWTYYFKNYRIMQWFAKKAYRYIAKNRYKWFGKIN